MCRELTVDAHCYVETYSLNFFLSKITVHIFYRIFSFLEKCHLLPVKIKNLYDREKIKFGPMQIYSRSSSLSSFSPVTSTLQRARTTVGDDYARSSSGVRGQVAPAYAATPGAKFS